MNEQQGWENPVPGSPAHGQATAASGVPFEMEEHGGTEWGDGGGGRKV